VKVSRLAQAWSRDPAGAIRGLCVIRELKYRVWQDGGAET